MKKYQSVRYVNGWKITKEYDENIVIDLVIALFNILAMIYLVIYLMWRY